MDFRAVLLSLIAISLLTALPASAWKQSEFIVTCWCAPPVTESDMATYAADGYNLTWSPADGLDVVAKHHIKALLQDDLLKPDTLDDPAQAAKLDALIKRVMKHPALEGYYLTDEPGAASFPGWGKLVAFIRARDPKHLAYINLFPTYATPEQLGVSADAMDRNKVGLPSNFAGAGTSADTIAAYREHLRAYLKTVKPELISYDHYHFLKGMDGGQYFLNLELIREAAGQAKLPFLNIIEACMIEPSWRLVNKNELRFLVYTTLAYGGKGISYFLHSGPKAYGGLYQDGVRMPLADDVAVLNAELKTLGPEMMKLTNTAVYQTAPQPVGGAAVAADSPVKVSGGEFVLGLFGKPGKTTAFMVVNRDYRKAATAQVTLSGEMTVQEFDRRTGKWVAYPSAKSRDVAIPLEPGDGRLFRLVGARY
jgi:hypothetical protein